MKFLKKFATGKPSEIVLTHDQFLKLRHSELTKKHGIIKRVPSGEQPHQKS